MKPTITNRTLLSAIAIVTAVLHSSCSTSNNSGAWAKIQSEGLIPYLVEAHSDGLESSPASEVVAVAPRNEIEVIDERASQPIHFSGVVTAQQVAGKSGFVYSPHTQEPLEIDVRDFQAGARVLCPYTKKSFVVPGLAPARVSPQPQPMQIVSRPEQMSDPAKRVVSTAPSGQPQIVVAPKKEQPKKIAIDGIKLDPKPIVGNPDKSTQPTESGAFALPEKEVVEVPVGRRVDGKPNYVYSPFAASNQVVDVEGHAAGTKVKCPYTGKVFAVPAPAQGGGNRLAAPPRFGSGS